MKKSFCGGLAVLLAAATAVVAQRRPLTPEPQRIQYGEGALQLRGLSIGFAQPPTPDDRLAGEALARILQAAAGGAFPLREGPASILLERTAPPEADNWDETPGPQSQEAYTLLIDAKGLRLRSRTSRGLFYGVQTIRQLLQGEGAGAALPAADIEDWPSLRMRGYMMDTSHGPLPTVEELKRQIDFLARWKYNQFYFYSEVNIELDGYRLLSPRARYRKQEVRDIIAYARQRFMEVVPCVELYGHLHDLVRIERYSELGEMPHGGEVNPRDPRVHRLIEDWVRQLTELFPSRLFHIGFDETYELGRAPGREMSKPEAGELYLAFFEKVANMVEARGRRVCLWGDILLLHPEVIPRLKQGTVAFPWNYSDHPDYDRFVQPFAEKKVPTVVTSGIWNWAEVAPDFDHTKRNVDGLLASGRKFGARGLLHTAWTDSGMVLMRMAWAGAAYGGVAAWQSTVPSRDGFYRAWSGQMFGERGERVAAALAAVSEAQQGLETALGGRTMQRMWLDPFAPDRLERVRQNLSAIRQARRRAEDAQEALLAALDQGAPKEYLEALLLGARWLDFLALRYLYAEEIAGYHARVAAQPSRANLSFLFGIETANATHTRLMDLMDIATELREEFRQRWLEEYTPYRLHTGLGRFSAEYEFWRAMQARVLAMVADFREGDPLPPLEALRPPR
jgi:hypothetical protein